MSSSNFFSSTQKTVNSNVGGINQDMIDNDDKYISRQRNYLNSSKQNERGELPSDVNRYYHGDMIQSSEFGSTPNVATDNISHDDKYHSYDPYFDYLQKQGLLKANFKTQIKTTYVNVNSYNRSSQPKMKKTHEEMLIENPLSFETSEISLGLNKSSQKVLRITHIGHDFEKGDKLTLSGIKSPTININTMYNFKNNGYVYPRYSVIFTEGSISVVILCNYDSVDSSMSFDPNFKIGDGIAHDTLKLYDTSDMFVTLSGFDVSTTSGSPFIGNIPINFLNSKHRMYFTNPNYTVINNIKVYSDDDVINIPTSGVVENITGFYIKLDEPYSGDQPEYNMKITMDFNNIGGIPINRLNAEFPVDTHNFNGFHIVHSVTDDTIDIEMIKEHYYVESSSAPIYFGGNEVYIGKIINLLNGYSSPSEYKIEFPTILKNVISVKMTSSMFPNTLLSVDNSSSRHNNKLYWMNQNDGDNVYCISVTPGNYTSSQLVSEIQNQICTVNRTHANIYGKDSSYDIKNYMTLEINEITNKVTFKNYRRAQLNRPITDTDPIIEDIGNVNDTEFILNIKHNDHGVSTGDVVVLSGFIQTFGISASDINKSHVVNSVTDSNNYTILLKNINLSDTRTNTGGGNSCIVLVSSKFKLLFDKSDTIGELLGFRNVGKEHSVTDFKIEISNNDSYENENIVVDDGMTYVKNESGSLILLKCNFVKLKTNDYIFMVVRELTNLTNTNTYETVSNFFTKINFRGPSGSLEYDSHTPTSELLYQPIQLSELNVSFYTSNGTLCDFNGIEHTYILSVTYIEYTPERTEIVSSNTIF
jgi:hypothetical protein